MFTQTNKAIEIAKNIEEKAMKSLNYDEQIELLERLKEKSTSIEEYEAHEKMITELKGKKRFDPIYYELGSEERETIEHNYNNELDEANTRYEKLKQEVEKELKNLIGKITPKLDEMIEISIHKYNANFIHELLDGHVQAKPLKDDVIRSRLNLYPTENCNDAERLKRTKRMLNDITKSV